MSSGAGYKLRYDRPIGQRLIESWLMDWVVIEASGQNTTHDGKRYNNKYCWVCRVTGGQLRELTEYMDTELVTATFRN